MKKSSSLREARLESTEAELERLLTALLDRDLGGEMSADAGFDLAADPELLHSLVSQLDPSIRGIFDLPPLPGRFRIAVTGDGLAASLEIDPPSAGAAAVGSAEVLKSLAERGIIHGINLATLEWAVELGRTEAVNVPDVARASHPVMGEPGHIELLGDAADTNNSEMELDAFGHHIPVASFRTVPENSAIARVVPPTAGTDGADIFGRRMAAEAGWDCSHQAGANVRFDEKEQTYFADKPGRVIVDNGLISIEQMLSIEGDLDISIGHVKFDGDLMVGGFVRSGLVARATGDIVVEGGVEAASVTSEEGSILIERGIQGAGRGLITAKFDVTARFAEHATITAGGVVELQNAVGCDLVSGEAVIVRKGKGAVRGGHIYTGGNVEVWDLGSDGAIETLIFLGVTPSDFATLLRMKERRAEAEEARAGAERSLHDLGLSGKSLSLGKTGKDGERTRKILGMMLQLTRQCERLQREEQEFRESLSPNSCGAVHVFGRVYPGVVVILGEHQHRIASPVSRVTIRFDPEREILAKFPLEA